MLPNSELSLFLLREELKSYKFFNKLEALGFTETYFQPDLAPLILVTVGFTDKTDKLFDWYQGLLHYYSKQLKPNDESVNVAALDFYKELLKEKESSAS